jgi:hypothetical protein
MAATGTLEIRGEISGLPEGGPVKIGPLTVTSANALGTTTSPVALSATPLVVAVPTGCTALLFVPPTANTQTIRLRPGDATGTGIQINRTQPTLLALDTTVTAIELTGGGAIAGCAIRFL